MTAPYEPDWAAVRRRIADAPWAAGVLAALEADFGHWSGLPLPGPERPSAWIHHYFCDADGAPLRHDPATPDRHACTGCGKVYSGEPWDGAWRAVTHNAAAAQAQRAALLLRLTGSRPARDELERVVGGYARRYPDYEPHGEAAGTGRVQPQALDEAVWAVGLLRAVRWAGDALTPATSTALDAMARAVAGLLRPQAGAVHNIPCWLLAALAECAVRLGDTGLLAWCRDSEFGAEAQVMRGFHDEGLWYEVNPHYHYYALAALLSYREAAGPAGLSARAVRRLSRAVTAPPMLAYADGRLPAYGDGWAECFTADFAPHAEAAWGLLPEHRPSPAPYYAHPRPAPVRLWYGAQLPEGPAPPLTARSSVAALVFGPGALPREPPDHPGPAGSFVWPGAGIGLLRSAGVRAALRYGPDAGWHDHRDKLGVDLATASGWSSLDLGTSGYGSDFTAWLRSPVAHNVVTVGGRPQPAHTGRLVASSPGHLTAESAFGGHTLRRTLTVTGDGWTDAFTVTLAAPDTIEWTFHGDGPFTGEGEPATLTGDLGHEWLRDVRRLRTIGGLVRGTWDARGAPYLELSVPEGFEAYGALAGGNPNGRPLGVLLLRGHAAGARIHARFALPEVGSSAAPRTRGPDEPPPAGRCA